MPTKRLPLWISRDLYHRAIEVMARAEALGEFVSLDAAESFAI